MRAPEAPPPVPCVRVDRPEPGLARLVLAPPHRRLAVLDAPLLRDLEAALVELERDASLQGLVVTGIDPLHFSAGADLEVLAALEDPEEAGRLARLGQRVLDHLHRLGLEGGGMLRTVAAAGGPVPGGAFEMALACDRIVLARAPSSRIGLPEVRLGILPGWGGCQRLPRRIGVLRALSVILEGRMLRPGAARRLGLVDRLTHPETLDRVAAAIALDREASPRRRRLAARLLIDRNPLATATIRALVGRRLRRKTHGFYPAPRAALDLVTRAPRTPLAEGLEREAQAIARLATGSVCKNLVRIFRGQEAARHHARLPEGDEVPPVRRVGILGAGVMGGSIASLLARRGIDARLRDPDRRALDRAVRDHRRTIRRDEARGRLRRHEAMLAADRLETTVEPAGFRRCDLVLEAVPERFDLKRRVLAEIEGQVSGDGILATNTSSLSVEGLAETLPHPERFVGIHFFHPVSRMPLVEIVRGSRTAPGAVARAARLAVDLGKTPVVVRDRPGFAVNRILAPYLDEALRLLEEGIRPERVDRVARSFGLPLGPLELLDEVGLDIAAHAARSLQDAFGERMNPSGAPGRLVERGRLGKKSGEGLYTYRRRGGKLRRGGPSHEIAALADAGAGRAILDDETILDRLLLPLVNEAARCLSEHVVEEAADLDLASVLGMGFPPFRGGVLRYADTRGPAVLAEHMRRIAATPAIQARPGGRARFEPAPMLATLAASGGLFHLHGTPGTSGG